MLVVDLHDGLEMYVFVCNLTENLCYRENVMIALENGFLIVVY